MTTSLSRREFLKRGAALSMAGAATPLALNLAAMGQAAAAAPGGYKALVCVFLNGGNDQANTLVPYDPANHAVYRALRGNLALARSELHATALNPAVALPGGAQYALAPALAGLLPLFNAGKLAVILNVGTLIQPTTKTQYRNRSVALPPRLFSHNDQASCWQTGGLPEGAASGWGGRLGDRFAAGNANALFTCLNAAGNATFLAGANVTQYSISPYGAQPVRPAALAGPAFGSNSIGDALRQVLLLPRDHALESHCVHIHTNALSAAAQLAPALDNAPALQTTFPDTALGRQLRAVARVIAARQGLNTTRQVFFVSLDGFDHHNALLAQHAQMLGILGDALHSFDTALIELGVSGDVTTFTGSEFGRSLISNGDGSDHGWGAVQFVMGGAVRGGYYGTAPVLANDGPDDVGAGCLLPALAVDQMAATLGRWMGASSADLLDILPNLGNFTQTDLGFMI